MCVSGEVGEHGLRPAKGRLGIDHPLLSAHWRQEGFERCRVGEVGGSVEELQAAIAMGGATFFVLVASSFLISSFRNWIPKQVRISCFIIIIATFVTVVDYVIKAISLDIHKELGATAGQPTFIGRISRTMRGFRHKLRNNANYSSQHLPQAAGNHRARQCKS